MTRWYVVHTQPRAEERARWHLENQGFECFLPRIRRVRRHARRSDTVLEPLFPRYLFIRFNPDAVRWRAVNGTRGVTVLLTVDGVPAPVREGVVEALVANSDKDGAAALTALGVIVKGLKVKISSGAFAGQIGEVAEILSRGRERVQVLMHLLGAQARLQLPAHAIDMA